MYPAFFPLSNHFYWYFIGNDIEDPDAPPPPQPREVIKNSTTSKKREGKPTTGDLSTSGEFAPRDNTTGGRGRPYSGNERGLFSC